MDRHDDIEREAILEELARIRQSPQFAAAERQQRFLTYVVERSLAGDSDRLKGYTIGVEVFDRPADFDPAVDAIVRVEAGRLRAKLREYFADPGRDDPIVFELPKGAYAMRFRRTRPAGEPPRTPVAHAGPHRSVAVLPMVNLSSDPDDAFFADGMTDAIINRLARIAELRVTSFTSVMRYKGSGKPLPVIASELGVDCIVEGTALRAGRRTRMTVQLIDAKTDKHLWADSYDRELDDVIGIQDEVAGHIGTALGALLAPRVDARPGHRIDPAAYEANLQGRRCRGQLTEQGLQQAIEWFNQAIALEPDYAEPYAGIAGCYCSFGTYGLELKAPHEVLPSGIELARKAIVLDGSSAEAHAFLGIMRLKYEWDWPGARAEFERALALSPSDARALLQFGLYFESIGDHTRAIDYAERVYQVDPINRTVLLNRGWQTHQAGQSQEALAMMQRLAEAEPGFWGAHWGLGHVWRELGALDAARAAFKLAVELPGGNTLPLEGYGHCCALAGDVDEARATIALLEHRGRETYVSPYRIATIYAGLGDTAPMYEHLEKAFEARARSLAWIAVSREYARYRDDARFRSLVKRIGIPVRRGAVRGRTP